MYHWVPYYSRENTGYRNNHIKLAVSGSQEIHVAVLNVETKVERSMTG